MVAAAPVLDAVAGPETVWPAELVCAPWELVPAGEDTVWPAELVTTPDAPDLEGVGSMMMVVLLLAETTTVRVEFAETVPARIRVVNPGPTAGIPAGRPTEVATAGWLVTTGGWSGMEEAAWGIPVTTPRELVSVRREVWGKASTDEEPD